MAISTRSSRHAGWIRALAGVLVLTTGASVRRRVTRVPNVLRRHEPPEPRVPQPATPPALDVDVAAASDVVASPFVASPLAAEPLAAEPSTAVPPSLAVVQTAAVSPSIAVATPAITPGPSPVAPSAASADAVAGDHPAAAHRLIDAPPAAPSVIRPIPDHGGRRLVQGLWLLLYAAAVAVPLALVEAGVDAPRRTFILELGSALGIAALSLLALQLVLPARLPILVSLGAEVAVRLHRRTADILLAVVVAHVAAVMVADPARLELLRFFGAPWRAQAAVGSVAALLVLFGTSIVRRRLKLPYVAWRGVHIVAGALALVLAVVHTVGVGRYLVRGPAGIALVALTLVGLGALVVMRSHRLRRGSVRPYTVDRVVPAGGGAITVELRADGHHGQRFIPGQFAWLKLADARAILAEHPFSYSSSAADPAHPSFTMQPRSGFTAKAAGFEPGTRLIVDGPHGAFRPRARSAGMVLVAGGIGITPSMSILRTAADHHDHRPYLLVYGAKSLDAMPFLAELRELEGRLRLDLVPVLSSPDAQWSGERGRINAGVFDRHLPRDLRKWQFMTCGSGPFVDGVLEALEAVGVPGERVHAERFVEV